jgi:hypothetical protein
VIDSALPIHGKNVFRSAWWTTFALGVSMSVVQYARLPVKDSKKSGHLLDHAHIEDQHIPSSHQTTILWHDSRITMKITNKSLHRECWVHFIHSMTHALRDVEVVELSVLVVGIPHWSKPLIRLEDSIVWSRSLQRQDTSMMFYYENKVLVPLSHSATWYKSIGSLPNLI